MQAYVHASKTHDASGPFLPRAVRDAAARTQGGYTFLGDGDAERFLTFRQLSDEIDVRARQLEATGLRKGDRVGLVLPDSYEFLVTFMGALSLGVVPVPMYPPMSFGKLDAYTQTAARILRAAEAKALITEKRVHSILWSLLDAVPRLEALHVVESLPDVGKAGAVEPPALDHLRYEDVAFIQFTSGSTSTPKGVVVTHGSLLANLHAIMKYGLQISPDDVAVTWLPMYHDMGLIGFMLAPLWYAVPTVFMPTVSFVKHPTRWMETVSKYRGTITFAPNFAYALATRRTSEAKLAKLDLSSLKALGCGAEPNHPATLRAFLEHFGKAGLDPTALLPCYGMAEATLAMTFCGPFVGLRTDRILAEPYHCDGRAVPAPEGREEGVLEFASCGRPLPAHEVVVVDDAGREVGDRTIGEIVFRGDSITAGYFRDPDATREAFTEQGLRTGDLGYLVDGELFVTGRKKDIIILNGRNYDPQSIEWEVAEVQGIRRGNVVAFSRPAAASEELIVVAETKMPPEEHDALRAAVSRRIRENLNLVPADVVLLGPGQLPKTSSGKLQRRRTREQYLDRTLGREGVRTIGSRAQSITLAKHLSKSLVARVRHGIRDQIKRRTQRVTQSLRRSESRRPQVQ